MYVCMYVCMYPCMHIHVFFMYKCIYICIYMFYLCIHRSVGTQYPDCPNVPPRALGPVGDAPHAPRSSGQRSTTLHSDLGGLLSAGGSDHASSAPCVVGGGESPWKSGRVRRAPQQKPMSHPVPSCATRNVWHDTIAAMCNMNSTISAILCAVAKDTLGAQRNAHAQSARS